MSATVPTTYLLSLTPFHKPVLKIKKCHMLPNVNIFFQHNCDFGYVIETCHIFDNQHIQNYYTNLLTSPISNCFTALYPTF